MVTGAWFSRAHSEVCTTTGSSPAPLPIASGTSKARSMTDSLISWPNTQRFSVAPVSPALPCESSLPSTGGTVGTRRGVTSFSPLASTFASDMPKSPKEPTIVTRIASARPAGTFTLLVSPVFRVADVPDTILPCRYVVTCTRAGRP